MCVVYGVSRPSTPPRPRRCPCSAWSSNAPARSAPGLFVVHALAGGVALTAGPLQLALAPRLLTRAPRVHRTLGRTYVGAAWLTSGTGRARHWPSTSAWPARSRSRCGRCCGSGATTAALTHIRKGRITQHQEWMVRSVALSLVFAVFSVVQPVLVGTGLPRDVAYPLSVLTSVAIVLAGRGTAGDGAGSSAARLIRRGHDQALRARQTGSRTLKYVIEDVNKWWFLARSGRTRRRSDEHRHTRSAHPQRPSSLARRKRSGRRVRRGRLRQRRHVLERRGTAARAGHALVQRRRGAVARVGERAGCPGMSDARCCRPRSPPRVSSQTAPATSSRACQASRCSATTVASSRSRPAPSGGSPGWSRSPRPPRPWSHRPCRPSPPAPALSAAATTRSASPPSARVRTRDGQWLLLYGTPLSGGGGGRVAVIVQPAPAAEIAPIVALAYGLSEREREVTRLCMQGRST